MNGNIKESDWKLLRRLHPVALERFCQRSLGKIEHGTADATKSYHQRFLDLYALTHETNRELGRIFDDPRRSVAIIQLAGMRGRKLLTDEEFSSFSQETRDRVDTMLKIFQQD